MTTDPTIWFQCPQPVPDPEIRLICFPHAGGSASFFRDWGRQLPSMEVRAVRYPGRAERISEPVPTDLVQLAFDVAQALIPLADRPLALFGHSLGAAVALETAACLEARGIRPAHLFASGSRNAPYPVLEQHPEEETDAAVVERLLTLGGTDPELAADPDFQELVLPYVRADGRMFHAYGPRTGAPLRCSVTTITGDIDHDADCRPWSELTTGGLDERIVPGDHFYLVPNPPFELLRTTLAAAAGSPA